MPVYERAKLALALEGLFQVKAKENQKAYFGNQYDSGLLENSPKVHIEKVDTRLKIARIAGVSDNTVARVKAIEAEATPETKEKLRAGDVSINEAYTQIKRIEKEERRESASKQPLENSPKVVEKVDTPTLRHCEARNLIKFGFSEFTCSTHAPTL